jgi:hypothetical protein
MQNEMNKEQQEDFSVLLLLRVLRARKERMKHAHNSLVLYLTTLVMIVSKEEKKNLLLFRLYFAQSSWREELSRFIFLQDLLGFIN